MIPRRLQIKSNLGLVGPGYRILWTFTLAHACPVADYRRHWNRLLSYLRKEVPEWQGVRVHEMFPGVWDERSHGMHTHVLSNRALSRKKARRICNLAGWGRISTKVVHSFDGSVDYLCKYLGKKRPPILKGWNLCYSFGLKGLPTTRLIDIQKTSALSYAWAHGKQSPRWEKLNFWQKSEYALQIRQSMILGLIPCPALNFFPGQILFDLQPF